MKEKVYEFVFSHFKNTWIDITFGRYSHGYRVYVFDKCMEIINKDLTSVQGGNSKRYVLDSGEYCWQECCETEMCKECARLNNGRMDYFDNTFIDQ